MGYDPNEPRDAEGKWTDGGGKWTDGGDAIKKAASDKKSILNQEFDLTGRKKEEWMKLVTLKDNIPNTLQESYKDALAVLGSESGDEKYSTIYLTNGKQINLRIISEIF